MPPTIRAPRLDELELLRDIEWAAGALFAEIGFAEVAADEPASTERLADYLRDGRAWVVVDDANAPVGYAIVDVIDALAHLEQLSVLPSHGRRGLGGALLEHVCEWAAQQHFAAVTLTTFTDIPWNAAFYADHGFRVLDNAEIGPELDDRRNLEAEHGLDPRLRVCMRRDS